MSDALLEVKQVSLSYASGKDSISAIDSIDLEVRRHEFVCLLGPSGCGKSSLLGLIAGFFPASAGEILLNGVPIQGMDWHRGVVFQKDNLFPWFSVRRNVDYGLRMRGCAKQEIREKTDAILERVGLSEFAERKVYELSGGMRQRASIARTLINQPDILLMDEPFSALDALTREQMQDFLRTLWKETGNTIFFITHDIDEAMSLGTRLLIMSRRPGRIMEELSLEYTEDIYRNKNSRCRLGNDYFVARKRIFELISQG